MLLQPWNFSPCSKNPNCSGDLASRFLWVLACSEFRPFGCWWVCSVRSHAYFLRKMRVLFQKRVASGTLDSSADTCLKWFISFTPVWNWSRFPHELWVTGVYKRISVHFSFWIFMSFVRFSLLIRRGCFSFVSLDVGADEAFSFKV